MWPDVGLNHDSRTRHSHLVLQLSAGSLMLPCFLQLENSEVSLISLNWRQICRRSPTGGVVKSYVEDTMPSISGVHPMAGSGSCTYLHHTVQSTIIDHW